MGSFNVHVYSWKRDHTHPSALEFWVLSGSLPNILKFYLSQKLTIVEPVQLWRSEMAAAHLLSHEQNCACALLRHIRLLFRVQLPSRQLTKSAFIQPLLNHVFNEIVERPDGLFLYSSNSSAFLAKKKRSREWTLRRNNCALYKALSAIPSCGGRRER